MTEYAFWRCMLRMFKWHAEGSLYLVFGVKRRGIYGFVSVNILGFSLPSCTVSPSLWFASGVLFIRKPWSSNNTLTVALCILPFVTAFSLINVCTLQFPIQRDCSFSATKTHSLWLPLCFCTISNLFSNLSLYLFSYIWNAILVSNQLSHWFFFFLSFKPFISTDLLLYFSQNYLRLLSSFQASYFEVTAWLTAVMIRNLTTQFVLGWK